MTSERSLCAFEIFRYCSPSLMTAGSAIWAVSSSKCFSSWSSLLVYCMAAPGSGDYEFAALFGFELHSAFQCTDGHRGLIVGWRLGGDALCPQAGRGEQ